MGRVQALKWPVQRSCTNPVSCAKAALPPQSESSGLTTSFQGCNSNIKQETGLTHVDAIFQEVVLLLGICSPGHTERHFWEKCLPCMRSISDSSKSFDLVLSAAYPRQMILEG